MALAFQFLGPPQLVLENEPVIVNRRSVVALLAYLSVNYSEQSLRTYTRESLSALLWPDYDQIKAFTNLRHTLWEIQKVLGPGWLIASRESIGLRAGENLWVDVHRFEALLTKSQAQSDASLRIPLLTECVKLYRHHFLTGFNLKNSHPFGEWSLRKADELRHKLTVALTLLIEDFCLLGDADSALQYARRLVILDPLNEFAHRLLMQVYAQVGQYHAALKQYHSFEQTLRKELNLDPQPETRALYKQIRKGDIKHVQLGVKNETISPPNNLPHQLTSFVGREKEQEEIIGLLARNRLVMLTGSGGIGKTRLSLQVGAKVLHQFPDGVWFIELAPLTHPDLIAQTMLTTLHLGEQAGKTPLMVLEEQLIHKKLLLILDNCEHLIAASAKVAHAILKSTSEIKILATSREIMSIGGEVAWRVPSLALPDPKSPPDQLTKYESVSLFMERALSVQPHLNMDETSMRAVAQICSHLDGIPLAIELAAARVNALGVTQIARRLDDRFRLLTKGTHIVLERHQTLRAAIDWSYNLLDADEKELLVLLSVFMGGWTLEAAEQIWVQKETEFAVLDVLSDLIDKSLVIMDSSTGEARYHLLETTRHYALEKLGESGEDKTWRDKHLAYFLELAEKGHSEITGPHQAEVIDLLDAELDNFRAALDWCVSNQYIEPALQMLGALGWAWDMRGYYNEVRSWFEKIRVQGNCADYPEAYARLLNHLGRFAADFDRRPDAESILEESRAIWLRIGKRGEQGLADVLCFLGMNAHNKGNLVRAESFYKKSLAVAQKSNNQRMIAGTMMFLGIIEQQRGRIASAQDLYEQSLQLSQQAGDLLVRSLSGANMAGLFLEQGNHENARPLLNQELEINEKLQFRFGLRGTWINFAELYRREGDYVRAEQCIEKSTSISRDLGLNEQIDYNVYFLGLLALHKNDYSSAMKRFTEYFDFDRILEEKVSLCRFLTGMSAVAGGVNQPERCAKLSGAAQSAIESTLDYRMDPFDRAEFDRHIQIARDRLGNETFEVLSKEGRIMTVEEAIEVARLIKSSP
jgi:predicted ATPase/DNA-binding SARP family transcriptional activator/Tfp pilus assembly protein PilF